MYIYMYIFDIVHTQHVEHTQALRFIHLNNKLAILIHYKTILSNSSNHTIYKPGQLHIYIHKPGLSFEKSWLPNRV